MIKVNDQHKRQTDDIKNIKLTDIIDLKFLQRFQDDFAESVGLASVTVDVDGTPITSPVDILDFAWILPIQQNAVINVAPNRIEKVEKKQRALVNRSYMNVMQDLLTLQLQYC